METRWRAATAEQPSAPGDALVVEVVDEAQPQRGLRAVSGSGAISASKRADVVVSSVATAGTSSVGSSRRRARWASIAAVVVTRYSQARRWSAWRSRG